MQQPTPIKRLLMIRHACAVIGLLFAGCSLFGGEEDNARINANGIEGVAFGDTYEEVVAKLGPCQEKPFIDTTRGWDVCEYEDGPYAGLMIFFADFADPDDDSERGKLFGPVDVLIVEAPYTGTTKYGIGVGSTVAEVRRAYGDPVASRNENLFYCLGSRDLELVVSDDTVRIIGLGYHVPFPDHQRCL